MPTKSDVQFPKFMSPDEIEDILYTETDLKKRVIELGTEVRAPRRTFCMHAYIHSRNLH